jgi:hypothetical protein
MAIGPKRARPISCGACPIGPLGVKQRVVLVGVAVRPAIDRDRGNVARRVEPRRTQYAAELVADLFLEFRETGRDHLGLA